MVACPRRRKMDGGETSTGEEERTKRVERVRERDRIASESGINMYIYRKREGNGRGGKRSERSVKRRRR